MHPARPVRSFGSLSTLSIIAAAAIGVGAWADDGLAPVPGGVAGVSALFADAARPATFEIGHVMDVARTRFVAIDVDGLNATRERSGSPIVLNLFADTTFIATFSHVEPAKHSDYVWMGELEGVPGAIVALAVNGRMVVGEVNAPEFGRFVVTFAGEGVHAVHQIDEFAQPSCGTTDEHAVQSAPMTSEEINDMLRNSDSNELVDILVVYTPAARNFSGGHAPMLSAIDSFMGQTNTAFNNSDIFHRVRLVHAEEVNYVEATTGTNPMSTDLSRLRSNGDGHMDVVHSLRNQFGADLVHLVSMSTGACGIAYLMTNPSVGFAGSGFGVTRYTCGGLTFAHELGHNKGSAHDHDNASNGAYCYSFGYRTSSTGWRTVMAYAPGTRIAYFSNPDITFNGLPLGISGDGCPSNAADNARSLDNTAQFVANFRKSVIGNPPPSDFNLTAPANNSIGHDIPLSLNWQLPFYATSYDVVLATDEALQNVVQEWDGINGTSVLISSELLEYFTEYYWSVVAHGFGGSTVADPEVSRFKTRPYADINGDGVVDFSDFNTVLLQYGLTGPDLIGDINGDNAVDFEDFSIVLSDYGQGFGD